MGGDIPAGPAGFTRYLMKSKFGAGRDFAVLDPDTEAQLFFVDGKLGRARRPRCRPATAASSTA